MRIMILKAGLVLALVLSLASPAGAQVEVEADPFAYALNGFSLHVAKVFGSVRANVGTFGLDVPGFYHGNPGWRSRMRGAGVKVDYLGPRVDGFFVGAEGGYMRMEYALDGQPDRAERHVVGVGVRGGYRLPLGRSGLYVAPWIGVGYNFDGDEVVLNDETFARGPFGVFPTVHVGWRF